MDPLEPFLFAMDLIFIAAIKAKPLVPTTNLLTPEQVVEVIETYRDARTQALAAVKP